MNSKAIFYSLAVGNNISYHLEAQLAVISLYAYSDENIEIMLFTDSPEHYNWLNSDRITISALSKEKMASWIDGRPSNTDPYFFRAKLCLAKEMSITHNCSTVWFDTDCVAVSPLSDLVTTLSDQTALMHKAEDPFSKGDTRAERAYWKALQSRAFAGIQANQHSRQWNSGIIGIPAGSSRRIETALNMLDEMMASHIPGRTLEQVAAGLALENTGELVACDEVVLHYWANKPAWHTYATHMLFSALNTLGDLHATAAHFRTHVEQGLLPAIRAERPSRLERHKRRWRKRLGLLAPCEK